MSTFAKYKTREKSNQGSRLFLRDPAGKLTEDWIDVRGIDSDAFQRASNEMRREMLAYLEKNGADARQTAEYFEFQRGQQQKMQVALVIAWSFDEPCDPANIVTLLNEAPDVAEQIDAFSGKRVTFAES